MSAAVTGNFDIAPGETRFRTGDIQLAELDGYLRDGLALLEKMSADASNAGDEKMKRFVSEVCDQVAEWRSRINALNDARHDAPQSSRDVVAESSMESFPSSDPPAY